MSIPFTQYLRPDGRKNEVTISRPPEIEKMAQAIMDAGYWFECEVLTVQSMCSFTVTDDKDDHAVELCPNGPQVPDAVDKLVTKFYATLGV